MPASLLSNRLECRSTNRITKSPVIIHIQHSVITSHFLVFRYALEQQLNDYKVQTETLLEEIQSTKSPSIQTVDNESQTVDEPSEKLTKGHKKLKRTYDAFQEKIQELISKRPDLFEGIGEETNERLDQLISTIENQTKQITDLQNERDHLISSSPR